MTKIVEIPAWHPNSDKNSVMLFTKKTGFYTKWTGIKYKDNKGKSSYHQNYWSNFAN